MTPAQRCIACHANWTGRFTEVSILRNSGQITRKKVGLLHLTSKNYLPGAELIVIALAT